MIGVVASEADREVVAEFFELFKTPWEHFSSGRRYDVVLVARDGFDLEQVEADIVVAFGARSARLDHTVDIEAEGALPEPTLSFGKTLLPIYGDCIAFRHTGVNVLSEQDSGRAVGVLVDGSPTVARVGYDLFEEVRVLLSGGQPVARAHFRALDMHVVLLRELILMAGVEVVEIPPVPVGYKFITCLTHDVDHPSIRLHRFDHTVAGFLYRALVTSVARTLAGRMPVRDLVQNWLAALRLPLVYLGLARDFWADFHRYTEIERGAESTFFVVPFKGEPGRKPTGSAPKTRAASYGVSDIAEIVRRLIAAGCEVGLHGLDAWFDTQSGKRERQAVCEVTGTSDTFGVRMHWLYFDRDSPAKLEAAGFRYDSTVGYNETIGFRSGTAQVYRLLGTRLYELPMHVMDTALFRPNYLDLTPAEAMQQLGDIIEGMCEFGGVLTLNWHDRSIAPERLWGRFYAEVLADVRAKNAWCTSARRAVSWFEKRRSVQFRQEGEQLRFIVPGADQATDLPVPSLTLRRHRRTADGNVSVDCVLS